MSESDKPKLIEWSPPWAPHVLGRYTPRERDEVTGLCEAQQVFMVCRFRNPDGTLCGQTWQTTCASGNVRSHINNFAKAHAHKDFTAPPRVVRPGSKRSTTSGT